MTKTCPQSNYPLNDKTKECQYSKKPSGLRRLKAGFGEVLYATISILPVIGRGFENSLEHMIEARN